MEIGLVPKRGSDANVGRTPVPAAVAHMPTMSLFAACIEKCPTAPRCPLLFIVTIPTPTVLAFLIAISIARRPRIMPSPLSALITAVPGVSLSIFQFGVGLASPMLYLST